MKIGFHVPFSGSLNTLEKRININGGNTFQIFTRGLRGGKLKDQKPDKLDKFHTFLNKKKINPVVLHAPYTYNLAVKDSEDVKKIIEDLHFADQLRAPYYVIQPGYYKDVHPYVAIEHIKENLNKVFSETSWFGEILIKNMVGAGTEIGSELMHYNELISFSEHVSGALDFARLYGSGFDFIEETGEDFFNLIEEMIGWDKIRLLYINDYLRSSGSKKNKYCPLGDGVIGYNGYDKLLQYKELQKKIWIVENQPELSTVDRSLEFLKTFYEQGGVGE